MILLNKTDTWKLPSITALNAIGPKLIYEEIT
jgi:hypothetical protein